MKQYHTKWTLVANEGERGNTISIQMNCKLQFEELIAENIRFLWAARKKTWSVTNNSVCDQQQLLLFSVSNIHLKWIWQNCWLIGFRKLLSSSLGSLQIRFASLILELNCFCFKSFSIGCQQLYVQPNWNAYKLNLVQRSARLRQKQSITGTVVLYAPLKVA